MVGKKKENLISPSSSISRNSFEHKKISKLFRNISFLVVVLYLQLLIVPIVCASDYCVEPSTQLCRWNLYFNIKEPTYRYKIVRILFDTNDFKVDNKFLFLTLNHMLRVKKDIDILNPTLKNLPVLPFQRNILDTGIFLKSSFNPLLSNNLEFLKKYKSYLLKGGFDDKVTFEKIITLIIIHRQKIIIILSIITLFLLGYLTRAQLRALLRQLGISLRDIFEIFSNYVDEIVDRLRFPSEKKSEEENEKKLRFFIGRLKVFLKELREEHVPEFIENTYIDKKILRDYFRKMAEKVKNLLEINRQTDEILKKKLNHD
jgi:hypothetical protein